MWAGMSGILGMQQVGDINSPDTIQRFPAGLVNDFVDNEYYGGGTFVYARALAAQEAGSICFLDNTFTAADIPVTANTGYPIYVAKAAMAINTWGWYQVQGLCPLSANASVAVGVAFGASAVGQVGTNSAGRQVLNARCVGASTLTIVKTNSLTQNGSPFIRVQNVAGLFVGLTASGAGISGTIIGIDSSQNQIQLSANASATGAITATFTFTNYILAQINSPFVQGAIT